jgi:hypothetical protein
MAYSEGLSIFPGGSNEVGRSCICRAPRFDLDPWGRLFIPHALICEINVVDNNDNPIVKFGQYGNADSRGPGSLVPGPSIPLATPMEIGTSDDYIYISDPSNARLLRVRMEFALDNMPLLSPLTAAEGFSGAAQKEPALTAAPSPFYPVSRVGFALPAQASVRLDVYSVSGRFIKTLESGLMHAGRHTVTWDATDARGRAVSSGVYVYRLTAGKQVLTFRTILSR